MIRPIPASGSIGAPPSSWPSSSWATGISVDFVPDTRQDHNRSAPVPDLYPGVGVVKVDVAALMDLEAALATTSSFEAR